MKYRLCPYGRPGKKIFIIAPAYIELIVGRIYTLGIINKEVLTMPHIDITMYPGRSEELKAELAKNVRDCAAETLKMDKKYFSVSIEEVDKDKWEEHFKKYEGNLYEKPNY